MVLDKHIIKTYTVKLVAKRRNVHFFPCFLFKLDLFHRSMKVKVLVFKTPVLFPNIHRFSYLGYFSLLCTPILLCCVCTLFRNEIRSQLLKFDELKQDKYKTISFQKFKFQILSFQKTNGFDLAFPSPQKDSKVSWKAGVGWGANREDIFPSNLFPSCILCFDQV